MKRRAVCWMVLLAVLLSGAGCLSLVQEEVSPADLMPALVAPPYEEERQPSAEQLQRLDAEERATYEVYRAVNRGVVNITSLSVGYNWFLQAVPQRGTGSGSILDQQGNVLTNHHVIKDSARLFVTLYDGSEFEARVVGVDPENDLAVIRFDPAGRELVRMPFGVSDDLVIGQRVIALGNPFGLERTLTVGVVSALRRPLQTPEGFIIRELIQTDAAINPGNSGGPLLSLDGTMVGVNTMILAPSGGSVGIGFAVPVDTAQRVVADLLAYGLVKRGWIQIEPVPIFPALAQKAGIATNRGILVSRILPGGNADRAGIRGGNPARAVVTGGRSIPLGGDVILAIDQLPVWTIQDFLGALESSRPGQTVRLEILRGSERLTISVVLVDRPQSMGW